MCEANHVSDEFPMVASLRIPSPRQILVHNFAQLRLLTFPAGTHSVANAVSLFKIWEENQVDEFVPHKGLLKRAIQEHKTIAVQRPLFHVGASWLFKPFNFILPARQTDKEQLKPLIGSLASFLQVVYPNHTLLSSEVVKAALNTHTDPRTSKLGNLFNKLSEEELLEDKALTEKIKGFLKLSPKEVKQTKKVVKYEVNEKGELITEQNLENSESELEEEGALESDPKVPKSKRGRNTLAQENKEGQKRDD